MPTLTCDKCHASEADLVYSLHNLRQSGQDVYLHLCALCHIETTLVACADTIRVLFAHLRAAADAPDVDPPTPPGPTIH